MATNLVQIEKDEEIKQRLEAERMRLRKIAGLDRPKHFQRPVERAFTAEERSNALSRAASEKGARGHALLYTASRAQPLGPARAELLQAMLGRARKDGE